jgi:hypothetical protein
MRRNASATAQGHVVVRLGPFVVAWRQLVTSSEPTHLPTILRMCPRHLALPTLREMAQLVFDRVEIVNRNGVPVEERPRQAFKVGEREYTPWDVADLLMHGAVFHSKDRAKKALLATVDPGTRTMLEYIFRQYVADITVLMDLTRLILVKAKEKDALSDEPIRSPEP